MSLRFSSIIKKRSDKMTRACMCIGTYNNPKVDPKEYLEKWSKVKGVVFVTGQLEKGAEGTPHI